MNIAADLKVPELEKIFKKEFDFSVTYGTKLEAVNFLEVTLN